MVIQFIQRNILKKYKFLTRKVHLTFLTFFVINIAFGIFFYFAEKDVQDNLTIEDSIWWAMVTMTTVGYGDYYPQTLIGRYLVAYPCFLFGITFIGYILGIISEKIIDLSSRKKKGKVTIIMKEHIIICNFPNEDKLRNIINELRSNPEYQHKGICVVTDEIEEKTNFFEQEKISFVKGDPTEEEILLKANIEKSYGILILAKNTNNDKKDADAFSFAISSVISILEQERNFTVKMVTEITKTSNMKLFQRAKSKGMVKTDGMTDKMLAQELITPGIHSVFDQLLTVDHGSQFYSVQTKINNMSFKQIQKKALEHKINIQIIGTGQGPTLELNPQGNQIIKKGEYLLIIAASKKLFNDFELSII